MNILVYNAYYTPERAASLYLEEDIAEGYAHEGNQVTMYVPTPSRGVTKEVRAEYKKRKVEYQHNKRLKIIRYSLMKEGRNPFFRAMRYILQNVKQYRCGINTGNADVIFSGSTPPTQGVMCALVKKALQRKYKRYVPYVYNLQDIFPDSLVNAGMAREGSLLWKIGRKIENYTYNNADAIIVISDGFKKNIMGKGVPEQKIAVVSNWIDIEKVKPVSKDENILYKEFGIDPAKFIVVYAGNFGGSQGADIVIQAANILRDEKNIQIVVFGTGTEYESAKKIAADYCLDNILFFDILPPTRVSEVYSLGDVALITGRPGVGKAGLPSKTWSIMACNTPIIASFDTESDLAEVLKKSGAGICVEPGNATALAGAIKDAYEKWKNEGKSSLDTRAYAIQNASKEICVKKYIDTLLSVAK